MSLPAVAQTAPVRRNLTTAGGRTALGVYAQAVAFLRNLPASDPRNWDRLAAWHEQQCPHGNWWLWPWHREYVRCMEALIRSLPIPGADNFAMPYWDWTRSPRVPPQFRDPSSVLYVADRLSRANGGSTIPAEITGAATMAMVYGARDWNSFGSSMPQGQNSLALSWQRVRGVDGSFEASPHNGVHNWIGGTFVSLRSPADPLFWLHHCNCDRIFRSWRVQGGAYPTSSLFRDFSLRGFFATSGTARQATVATILNRAVAYDRLDPAPSDGTASLAAADAADAVAQPEKQRRRFRAERPLRAALGLPGSTIVDVQGAALSPEASVRLLRIQAPQVADAPFLRVFACEPDVQPSGAPGSPAYVGTVSFFGTPAQHGPGMSHGNGEAATVSFALPLGDAATFIEPGLEVRIQVVPVPIDNQPVQQVAVEPAVVEVEVPVS